MRIAFLVRPDARPGPTRADAAPGPQVSRPTAETIAHLRAAGAAVDVLVPEAAPHDLADRRPRHDVYVLKSKTPTARVVAAALTVGGARCVNSAEASRLAKDKLLHTPLLAAAGVPLPPSWIVGGLAALRALLSDRAGRPVLVKPPGGSMAEGIVRLTRPADLEGPDAASVRAALAGDGPVRPLLVQGAVPSDGLDLKLYVVGDWVAAIRRPFPARSEREKRGVPAEVPPPIRAAALACGRALGLELYGVDVLTGPDGYAVVDVNAYPSYQGIDEAPRRVADHLLARAADRVRRGLGGREPGEAGKA